ncbi:sensor histidine kinase [Chitinophaga costaii]|uniref:sensor histidine kinase n=1 Tax=Chitinophaga costaii TaxID=1335309 RepID=UPI0013FD1993|nr:sensor histidine kinase [Chitinophaga costaii]
MLTYAAGIRAQDATPLHFRSITINDGLSQGYVSCIMQDKQGFMWFATGDGLNKYDGYTFTVYHHNPDDPTSIASDDLTYVFEDSQQRLWIATRNNGLDYFDRKTNTFHHFRSSGEHGILSDKVGEISESNTGALWIGTYLGVDRMEILPVQHASRNSDFLSENTITFTHIRADKNFDEKKPGDPVRGSFLTDSRGHTYVATANRIYELVFNTDNTYRFVKKTVLPARHNNFISVLMEDAASHSLLMNSESAVMFPNYDVNRPHTLYEYKDHVAGHVAVIAKNQMLWMAENHGIKRIHIPDNTQGYYEPADSSQTDALRTATCMFSDRQGLLWIGTGGYGILKYDPEKERFHHILPNTRQYQLVELQPGIIVTNNFEKITLQENKSAMEQGNCAITSLQRKFLNHHVLRLTKDTANTLWIPDGRNITSYNLLTQEEHTYKVWKQAQSGQIFPLYIDRHNTFWFGRKQQFFHLTLPGNLSTINYPLKQSDFEEDFLQAIYEDGDTLWLGTIHGLFRYSISRNSIEKYYYFQPNDSTSLSNNFIYCICNDVSDPHRYLWIGTKGGGLNRLDKSAGKFVRYSTKNGLANNVIYGMLPGDDGNLWLSTNKGLTAFNNSTSQFRNYDADDGLQSNEFNRYAYCKTSNGWLVFGGMNGINYFDPKEIKPLEPPDISFTDFRLFNKPVNIKAPDAPLNTNINYAAELRLKYKQNVITFQFAAMDYRREGNIVYRYKMNGFDKDWIYASTAHEATYTNLDPGKYDFIVQASFEGSLWSNKKKSISVIILTPWYKAWWFYLLVTTITCTVIYAMYRYRLYQLKRLEKLRNRIARDLHDEVGSSISTIAIYSKIMQEQVNSVDFDNEPLIHKINDFATEIMASMNDIVWNINTKNDAFDRIIIRMREQASQLLEAKGYTVQFDFDEALGRMKLNMERRREFYLLYKEAINNIAKYADGENVWISLLVQNGFILLSIKDDGRGFDKEKLRNTGNGLANMQHRAETLRSDLSLDTTPGCGTTVTLKFHAG